MSSKIKGKKCHKKIVQGKNEEKEIKKMGNRR